MASFFIDIEKLIKEVEKRPGLYHKDAPEYNDKNAKIKLWIEVCEAVIPNWHKMSQHEKNSKGHGIKNKWHSLRSCFMRELNYQKRSYINGEKRKTKKYVHFDSMAFLIPCLSHNYVGNYDLLKFDSNTSMDQEGEEEDRSRSTTDREDQDFQDADETEECRIKEEQLQFESTSPEEEEEGTRSITDREYQDFQEANETEVSRIGYEQPHCQSGRAKKRKMTLCQEDSPKCCRCCKEEQIVDEDKSYLLSLLPSFKRLSHKQKVLVKMEYLHTLYKVMYDKEQPLAVPSVPSRPFSDLNNS